MTIKTWEERTHENQWQSDTTEYMQAEIDELRAALDSWEKQEPVATMHETHNAVWFSKGYDDHEYSDEVRVTPLYVALPWSELTEPEIFAALVAVDPETKRLPPGFHAFATAISETLRRKNERSQSC